MTTGKQLEDTLARLGLSPTAQAKFNRRSNPEIETLRFGTFNGEPDDTLEEFISKTNQIMDRLEATEKTLARCVKQRDTAEDQNCVLKEKVSNLAKHHNRQVSENVALKQQNELLTQAVSKKILGGPNTMDMYQDAAMRTYKHAGLRNAMLLGALGLTGEAGEVAELVKKAVFHDKAYENKDLVKELGDVLWYLAVMAKTVAGVSLGEVAKTNIDKLKARYPEGFDTVRANNRAPTDA